MYSGASGRRIIRRASPTLPGAASGGAWLGVMVPQLPCELPLPIVRASITRTLRPSASSASAVASPTTPAPTTTTSLRCSMRASLRRGASKRRHAPIDEGAPQPFHRPLPEPLQPPAACEQLQREEHQHAEHLRRPADLAPHAEPMAIEDPGADQ